MNALRKPSELKPRGLEPLARLPVFFGLEGKRVVLEGSTPAAAWKLEMMLAAGADVALFSAEPCEELLALAADPVRGSVTIHPRSATLDDLSGAMLAIGAFEDDCDAAVFASLARGAGVPVNVIDKPAFCDFSFGAIVNRSPLVIGISTDGAAPIFAQAVRSKIESMIPRGFSRWADAARRWRSAVQSSGLSFGGRRRFWQHFVARAVAEPEREPQEHERGEMIAAVSCEPGAGDAGSVTLVGAGPGDPELLTLRAVRALQSADVILIDDLVAPEVLDFARREAKKMLIGKTGHGPSCKQDEINALMVTLARAGKRVVRLKGGDPMVFGRAGEEIDACAAAGIAVEIVPGVTAAQGAASRIGISLTHRDHARRVQFVTGHDKHGGLAPDLCWASIADTAATTVVYMPGKVIAAFTETAIANGLPPQTPTIAISRATRSDETTIASTLADLPQRLVDAQLPGPLLVMIGDVFSEKLAASADVKVALSA
ncbi:siroheme synthase [Variibacter gotjawalensis]|uniref:Siroheme synthase n=1 Tax=Variibacter gotjawalensis TaxID=1333996 RepID=A0A0S3PNI3_9BRAD|nr:siroheme synthase CysG [Variibacter gotjawalensis]NIK47796.1 uroporphyrin-III C-methyltransferase/precorrin-2 dehydrogenase/sirohydrochlorin ferrochelatase [Variibacter gotjawalensis]RZS49683.1 uroporphyrin-III C-methyltransferase/precorrin-2 dehydrogenase/sirohydrochlorin ferrochelatase [Variibacter gotjawalensis]BAT57512.1 siroheme synthase [Variibacter gotjawalensis]